MSMNNSEPTVDEFIEYIEQFPGVEAFKHRKERAIAIISGWKDQEYSYLYRKYILSTQRKVNPKFYNGKDKGDDLEELAIYFLRHGGIVKDIGELKADSKWQIDGQGIINKSIMEKFWGEELIQKIGFQVYLECKNHIKPTEKNDFNDHCTRMEDNNCNLGIIASTSGFKISKGQGIAERVYLNTYKNKFYLLISIRDFDSAHSEKKPPISILTEALNRTTNDLYRIDKLTQQQYTKDYCHKIAKDRYNEFFK